VTLFRLIVEVERIIEHSGPDVVLNIAVIVTEGTVVISTELVAVVSMWHRVSFG